MHIPRTAQQVHTTLLPILAASAVDEVPSDPEVAVLLAFVFVLAPGGRRVAPVAVGGREPVDVEEDVVRRVDDDCVSCVGVEEAVSDAPEGGLGGVSSCCGFWVLDSGSGAATVVGEVSSVVITITSVAVTKKKMSDLVLRSGEGMMTVSVIVLVVPGVEYGVLMLVVLSLEGGISSVLDASVTSSESIPVEEGPVAAPPPPLAVLLTPNPTRCPSKSNTVYTFFKNTSPTSHCLAPKVCRPIIFVEHAPFVNGAPM
jgi:hypothetical protein